ncbi:MAG: hypothetical protein LBU89_14610 [Fibromonadaceae bacterium]|jgi:GMP synthase (glutamine-hydrolysing)|nr:hypothetical protein [Fibromonadaceae bacterium]
MIKKLPQISEKILKEVGNKKVFLLVSGGVDSTVLFVLLNRVLGSEKVLGLHIDTGMMRLNESKQIMDFLQKEGINNLQICNASEEFLAALQGIIEPEQKRNIIGEVFLKVANREMQRLALNAEEWMLAQGTIYPDTVESGTAKSALVKTHHNRVQGILDLQEKGMLLEPLASLYKDEVRILGEELCIPRELVWRHPFPGPGLGVRVLCSDGKLMKSVGIKNNARTYVQPLLIEEDLPWEDLEKRSVDNRAAWLVGCIANKFEVVEQYCTKETLDTLRFFDDMCLSFLNENNLYNEIWQMPVVLLPLKTAGKPCIVMRPVNSVDAMTANFTKIDQNLLKNKLWPKLKEAGLGALFYDVTNKPPATIEWE